MLQLKRWTALLLAILLTLALFACAPAPAPSPLPSESEAAVSALPTPEPTPDPEAKRAAELVREAYALSAGQSLPGLHTLSGEILSVDTPWSDRYQNLTVTIQVGELADMPILCFRLEGSGAEGLKPGDRITVSGTLTNYKGIIEFDEGCTLVSLDWAAPSPEPAPLPTAPDGSTAPDRDGYYYDPESVVLYLHLYGQLPPNFITKDEAGALGWSGGSVERWREGGAIGGDRFHNREKRLPSAPGRTYTECDMYTRGHSSRGSCRLVFSNDGLYFYTDDHYNSFTQLYVNEEGVVVWK